MIVLGVIIGVLLLWTCKAVILGVAMYKARDKTKGSEWL
jgi:hypothetical protein